MDVSGGSVLGSGIPKEQEELNLAEIDTEALYDACLIAKAFTDDTEVTRQPDLALVPEISENVEEQPILLLDEG